MNTCSIEYIFFFSLCVIFLFVALICGNNTLTYKKNNVEKEKNEIKITVVNT